MAVEVQTDHGQNGNGQNTKFLFNVYFKLPKWTKIATPTQHATSQRTWLVLHDRRRRRHDDR